MKNILLTLAILSLFAAAVYLDNHLPGLGPVETRRFP
jgi:hypothetical protein